MCSFLMSMAKNSRSDIALGSHTLSLFQSVFPYSFSFHFLLNGNSMFSVVRRPNFFHSTSTNIQFISKLYYLSYTIHTICAHLSQFHYFFCFLMLFMFHSEGNSKLNNGISVFLVFSCSTSLLQYTPHIVVSVIFLNRLK